MSSTNSRRVHKLRVECESLEGRDLQAVAFSSLSRVMLNPQPLPPAYRVMLNPQPLPPAYRVMLNPQPLPPRY